MSSAVILSLIIQSLLQVYRHHKIGRGGFVPSGRRRHVVVVGRPSAQTVSELVKELYHPDHSMRSDLSDLPDLVMLLSSAQSVQTVQDWLHKKENVQYMHKVTVLKGSVFDADFMERSK